MNHHHPLSNREAGFGNAFTIAPIPKLYVDDFNIVANTIPSFVKFIKFFRGKRVDSFKTLTEREIYKMAKDSTKGLAEILSMLRGSLVENATPIKRRQKLFRHLRIIETFVEMLRSPFSPPKGIIAALSH